jgi:Carboxypeptidase regulatory-like domain
MRALAFLALAPFIVGCNGSSPTSPGTSAGPIAWTLSGTVTSQAGGAITGATVLIVDGPNAGAQVVTDANGRYAFASLQQAGFTVRVSANGYLPVARGVTLTGNAIETFQLFRNAVAQAGFTVRVSATGRRRRSIEDVRHDAHDHVRRSQLPRLAWIAEHRTRGIQLSRGGGLNV